MIIIKFLTANFARRSITMFFSNIFKKRVFEEKVSHFEHFFTSSIYLEDYMWNDFHITLKRSPLPFMSVKLNILPPEIDFNILVVACATFGFFVFAETTIPINRAATLTAGFKIFFQAVCVPLNFFKFTLNRSAFELKLLWTESNLFLTLTFGISCNFSTVQILFKWHHAKLFIADLWPWVHLAFLTNFSPLVIYLVKICDLLRPHILQLPFVILTSFLVLGFTF